MSKENSIASGRAGLARRQFLTAGVAIPFFAIGARKSLAAEFPLKMVTVAEASHPLNIRSQEAIERIKNATGGRVAMSLFPGSKVGQDRLFKQLRYGEIALYSTSTSILGDYISLASILTTGFAFGSYDRVWKAVDSELGKTIREEIARTEIFAVGRIWDHGFRQITSTARIIHTPSDLKGFRLRVPNAPLLKRMFRAFGAEPKPMNLNETYAALRTELIEGEENPLPLLMTNKFYEVQKYCSLTSHVWDGYWILANRRVFDSLPPEIQAIIVEEFDRSALDQRADIAKWMLSLRSELEEKGMQMIDVDQHEFREALRKTSFFEDLKEYFGDEAWSLFQATVGAEK